MADARKESMKKEAIMDMVALARELFRSEVNGKLSDYRISRKAVGNLEARLDLVAGMCAKGAQLRQWRDTIVQVADLSRDIEESGSDFEVDSALGCFVDRCNGDTAAIGFLQDEKDVMASLFSKDSGDHGEDRESGMYFSDEASYRARRI